MTQTNSNRPGALRASSPPPAASLIEAVDAALEARREGLIKFRRRLHAMPEASGEERETTAFIAEALTEHGFTPRIMQQDTGIAVDVDLGAPDSSFIALRAELDCVQVNDDKQVAYASTRPGLCHACGHDVHSTVVYGASTAIADQLAARRGGSEKFAHNLRLIFQPAEENATGARSMIQQGVLNGVKAILAVHVDPFLEAGRLGFRKGPITAGCKSFRVHVRGRGGHTARPYEAIDPIAAAINVVQQFYMLCPRSIDARSPMVLTVASIGSGRAINAIPDETVIAGTLRSLHAEDSGAVQRRMQSIVQGVAQATGCGVELEFEHYCPPTDNDDALVELVARYCEEALPPEAVQWVEHPSMGGEDFAFYQELIPGLLVRLGAALPDPKLRRPLHSSFFDVDEAALLVGARYLARAALHCAAHYHPAPS